MSVSLEVPFAGLRRGPVTLRGRLEDPVEVLGDLPGDVTSLDLDLEVRGDARSGVRARGTVRGIAHCECRRCLEQVDLAIDARLDAWFRQASEVTPGEDGVWAFEPDAAEVDLSPAVREEVWLAVPEYPVCDEACVGLCPRCGANLREEECTCPEPEPDPRWEALRMLGGREAGGGATA